MTTQTTEHLLDRHGRTFSNEVGIDLGDGTPSSVWRWAVASLLMSARISSSVASESAQQLFDRFGTTSRGMADSSWEERVEALNAGGYTRYQERTASMLGEVAEHVGEEYGHDLRRLRREADRDPGAERARLKDLKGIGDVGADIFFREIQNAWTEWQPFADEAALDAARALGIGSSAEELVEEVGQKELPRLLAALVRADQADELERIAA